MVVRPLSGVAPMADYGLPARVVLTQDARGEAAVAQRLGHPDVMSDAPLPQRPGQYGTIDT